MSERREWMLTEARARMVDVETGEQPRAMRPLAEDPPAEAPPPPPRTPESTSEAAPDLPAASDAATPVDVGNEPPIGSPDESAGALRTDEPPIASLEDSASAFGTDGVLWLEDSPTDDLTSAVEGDGDAKSAPWRRGLRG